MIWWLLAVGGFCAGVLIGELWPAIPATWRYWRELWRGKRRSK